jgi:hypothetical protein
MVEKSFIKVLRTLCDTLKVMKNPWLIGGSISLQIQGVLVSANDVDVITTKKGAYEVEKLLKKHVIESVKYSENKQGGRILSSYWGKAVIKGVKIDIVGDMKVNNELLMDFKKEKVEFFIFEGMRLPLSNLRIHKRAYSLLGRAEKAEKISKHLNS